MRVPFPDGGSTWTCDLKKLQNRNEDLLATGNPPAGGYSGTKITVQSAKIFFDNPAVSATPCARTIAEPAGAAFAMTIANREAQVNGSYPQTATVLIDFDGEESISENGPGAYVLNPVIRLVSVR